MITMGPPVNVTMSASPAIRSTSPPWSVIVAISNYKQVVCRYMGVMLLAKRYQGRKKEGMSVSAAVRGGRVVTQADDHFTESR